MKAVDGYVDSMRHSILQSADEDRPQDESIVGGKVGIIVSVFAADLTVGCARPGIERCRMYKLRSNEVRAKLPILATSLTAALIHLGHAAETFLQGATLLSASTMRPSTDEASVQELIGLSPPPFNLLVNGKLTTLLFSLAPGPPRPDQRA